MLFPVISLALSMLTLTQVASAHFTLDYPPTRGFDEDLEPKFCGGFDTPSQTRTPFSLGNATMTINNHHDSATVSVLIALDSDPTSFFQFSNGTTLPFVKSYFTVPKGINCFYVDLSTALENQNIANGTLATLQVRFDGGDGDLFQCSDVILLSEDTTGVFNQTTCPATTSTSATSSAASQTQAHSSSAMSASAAATAAASASASVSSKSAGLKTMSSSGLSGLIVGGLGLGLLIIS